MIYLITIIILLLGFYISMSSVESKDFDPDFLSDGFSKGFSMGRMYEWMLEGQVFEGYEIERYMIEHIKYLAHDLGYHVYFYNGDCGLVLFDGYPNGFLLQSELDECIAMQDYERAAEIRDIINKSNDTKS